MRRIFLCGCCCRENSVADDDAVSGHYWSIFDMRVERKSHEQSTLPTVVTNEPGANTTARNSAEDFVDIDFPKGSFEDDRFGDMSATIFKRIQK